MTERLHFLCFLSTVLYYHRKKKKKENNNNNKTCLFYFPSNMLSPISRFEIVYSIFREDPLATHSSILAWRIPWTEEPSRLQSMGSQRVGQD